MGPLAVSASGQPRPGVAAQAGPKTASGCPSPAELSRLLSSASEAMEHEQFEAAATTLKTTPAATCDPRLALLLSAALEGAGHAAEAQQTLDQAHRRWPTDHGLAASLARSDWLAGRPAEAAEAIGSVPITPETPVQELELRAEIYLATHQLRLAQTAAEAAFRSHPSTATLLLLANTIQTEGRAQDALALLTPNRTQNAGSVPFLITIAECEFDAGSYAAAHDDLASAVALDPSSYQAHYLLGNTLVKQQKIPAAITEYKAAIDLAPGQPRTYHQLALAQVIEGDVSSAEQSLTQALAADDRYAPAYTELADLLMQQGRFADAVEPLRKAIQYGPTQESPYYLLTRVYARLGQTQQSHEMLERYQEVKAANLKRPTQPASSTRSSLATPPHTLEP